MSVDDDLGGVKPAAGADSFVRVDGLTDGEYPETFGPDDVRQAIETFWAVAEWMRDGRAGAVAVNVLSKGEPSPLLVVTLIDEGGAPKASRVIVVDDIDNVIPVLVDLREETRR